MRVLLVMRRKAFTIRAASVYGTFRSSKPIEGRARIGHITIAAVPRLSLEAAMLRYRGHSWEGFERAGDSWSAEKETIANGRFSWQRK